MKNLIKPTVIDVFNDDGTHSHWALIDTETGTKIWSEFPEECKAQGYPVEGLTKEDNLCSLCSGSKKITLRNKNIMDCPSCDATGTLVGQLNVELRRVKNELKDSYKEQNKLLDWIKRSSTCKTCEGNQYKTFGGGNCKECGLEGKMPWGG